MKHQFRLSCLLLAALLSACSSAPKQKAVQPAQTQIIPVEPIETELTANDYLEKAKQATPDRRNLYLFKAAEMWQQQQQCDKSIKLVDILRPELYVPLDISQANLIEAECLFDMGFFEQSNDLTQTTTGQMGLNKRLYLLKAKLLEHQLNWIEAANAWQKVSNYEQSANQHIWPLLKKLSLNQLEQAQSKYPSLNAWLELTIITRKYSADAYRMAQALSTWKNRYPSHPAINSMPSDLDQALHTDKYQPQTVAVLLPLSGRLQLQGEALKQGILAAYFEHENARPEVSFIDSNLMTESDMTDIASQYDFIVGPLEKERIEQLLQKVPADKPVLALNRVNSELLASTQSPLTGTSQPSQHFYFALAPEDEAEQLVAHLLDKGYQHPVVISSGNKSMQRMLSTFVQSWQQHTQYTPNSVTFESSGTMRSGIANLLEVNQSRSRIKQIENLYPNEVHAFYRNRQDVDAIVVFANAEETELLVPIIEASISPFSEVIPVYGSSRSYTQVLSNNSLRDLRNLTFIDMPWMLPNHPWQQLKHTFARLWPAHTDSLQRLFAMGYDAYSVIPHLKHMAILPELRLNGLTGQIWLDDKDILHQRFAMGKVEQEQVIRVEMD